MKTCPFCAEEIQDDAIKCKHCKEWLKEETNNEKVEFAQTKKSNPKTSDKIIEVPNKPLHDITEDDEDESKYIPLKKQLGWGQWVLLCFLGASYNRMTVKPNAISGIVMLILPFVIYFGLRRRMIGFFSKLWKVSLVAGLIAFVASVFIVGLLMRFGL